MWKTLLPKNANGLYTSLLNIEKVHVLDEGTFTCKVNDWGFSVNKSIQINVKLLPNPTLVPLSATVVQDEDIIMFCYSPEDNFARKYGYNWLKNGEILNPIIRNEVIEDLYPTGSRILIKKIRHTATYTCIVSTSAGTTLKNAIITVLSNGNRSS